VLAETIIAVILVVYTLVRFLEFIFAKAPVDKTGKVSPVR
jgi:exfoliative toxin A/B